MKLFCAARLYPGLVAATGIWLGLAQLAFAEISEEIQASVRGSLVHIRATGISSKDSSQKTSEGTGFYVSQDGFILTNYHLLAPLDGVDADTIVINVGERPNTLNRVKVLPVQGNEIADILVLKAPEDGVNRTKAKIDFTKQPTVGSALYSIGFPTVTDPEFDTQPALVKGNLSKHTGPTASLWTTSIAALQGQSGSPVFTDDGTVIGILKGTDKTAEGEVSYIVPIKFVDPLLPQLRVQQLREELELVLKALGGIEKEPVPLNNRLQNVETNINDLRRIFEWQGDFAGEDLKVQFTKLVGGEPKLRAIRPQVTPYARLNTGGVEKRGLFRIFGQGSAGEILMNGIDERSASGFFLLPNIKNEIANRIRSDGEIKNIPRLSVSIIPVLEDGKELPPQTIEVRIDVED
jgi:S1-C subfamily serine protease